MTFPEKISPAAEQKLQVGVWIVTALVLLLVGMMRRPELRIALPDGVSLTFLPAVYSTINVFVAMFLLLALAAIKKKNITQHRRFINTATLLSGVFLLMYVAYHFTNTEVRFTGTGFIRIVYFFILITHITLAAVSLPFILMSYIAGWADKRDKHRSLVKWVFPMWLYVAITGPVVFVMLKFYR